MADCCRDGCHEKAKVHLVVGAGEYPIKETTDYTGGSFCSWEHLAHWVRHVAAHDDFGVPMEAHGG